MDPTAKTFPSDNLDTRRWIGRIIMAVILGEAIWSLIVAVMNNLIVPWLGDVLGPTSGLPASFTQRPYNYPDFFVSVVEFCVAVIVAVVLNHFFQRQTVARARPVEHSAPAALPEPARIAPQAPTIAAMPPARSPVTPPAPVANPNPVASPRPVAAAVAPAPLIAQAPLAKPVPVAPPAQPAPDTRAAKPLPPAPKAEPAKPTKPKEVYYNIVGEPMPSDDE